MRTDARRRRARIIDAACELLRTLHPDKVTMELIAERAEVGIATVYRNFPDRTALDIEQAKFLFTRANSILESAISDFESNPRHTWNKLCTDLLDMGLGILAPSFAPLSESKLSRQVESHRKAMEESINTLIDLAKKHGIVHESVDVSTFVLGLVTVCRPPISGLTKISPTFSKDLLGIFLSGIEHGNAFDHPNDSPDTPATKPARALEN